MKHTEQTTDTVSDRIKLPFSFDVEQMAKEVQGMSLNHFIYYNVIPLRAPAHQVDQSLPFPPPTDDYADGSWTDWLDTAELKASAYITNVIETFSKHTKVTLVRVLRLAAGNVVAEHVDPTLGLQIEKSVIRLTIPIIRGTDVDFFLNEETVPMKPGECWYMRLTDPHKVVNSGDTDRVSLTIDMIPNEWVREMIMDADSNQT